MIPERPSGRSGRLDPQKRQADPAREEVRIDNLEQELDYLYALEPAMFVSERDQLARDLRKTGRREEAEQVKRLRKPALSAWTINQLARQERRDVDLLLDAGHRLREAQQGLFSGEDRKSLDEARSTHRDALANLRQAARDILVDAGHKNDATLERIMGTLQAAAVSGEGRELLARGRLTGDLDATGFELLAPLVEGMPPKQEPAKQRPSERKRAAPRKPASGLHERDAAQERQRQEERKRVEDARRDFREAKATSKAAEKDLREAERDASKARRELAQAEERVHKNEAAAAAAQMAVERAEKQLRDAGKEP